MRGVIRAAAVFVCLLALGDIAHAQVPVDWRNTHERILAILPLIGAGTGADPVRPSLIPAPGGTGPAVLSIAPAGANNKILGYAWVASDDGNFALTEIVMNDRSSFPAILAMPGVTAFVKGVNTRAEIETAFQKYKKGFDATKFGVRVP